MRGPRADRPRRGFTLIELTLVLAILSVAALVIAPAIVRSTALGERRDIRNGVAQLLRDARLDATRGGQPVEVRWLAGERRLVATSEGARPVPLPEGWGVDSEQVRLAAAATEAGEPSRPVTLVVFSPQGLASRSVWRVLGPSGEVIVTTDAFDGLRVD